jgi:hypothetical protein
MTEERSPRWSWRHIVPIVVLGFTTIWGFYAARLQIERGRLDFALDSSTVIASLTATKARDLRLVFAGEDIPRQLPFAYSWATPVTWIYTKRI